MLRVGLFSSQGLVRVMKLSQAEAKAVASPIPTVGALIKPSTDGRPSNRALSKLHSGESRKATESRA